MHSTNLSVRIEAKYWVSWQSLDVWWNWRRAIKTALESVILCSNRWLKNRGDRMAEERIFAVSTGPFTHAIFDAISDAILRTKRALPTLHDCCFREASRGLERKLSNIWRRPFFEFLLTWRCILSQRYATKNPCGVGWGSFCMQNRIEKSHV